MTREQYILDAVRRYEATMLENGIRPLSPTKVELSGITGMPVSEIDEAVEALIKEGTVITRQTLNSEMVQTQSAAAREEMETEGLISRKKAPITKF